MERTLFGTDGIRGIAGEYPLDPRTVHAAGVALGEWSRQHHNGAGTPEVVIGMDTRESGPVLAAQLAGGLARAGVRARLAGLITTPGVAWLTRNDIFVAGVMISASHNPYQDNGIKAFGHNGYKLPDEEEYALEQVILRLCAEGIEPREEQLEVEAQLDDRYLEYLASTFPAPLGGIKIALDCGNGAATHLAPVLMRRLGADVQAIGVAPDGRNINLQCGSLHMHGLQRAVVEADAEAGFAFDGDADRCIAVSRSGKVVDGDALLLLCARHLKAGGRLSGSSVVATVMSNLGLEKALAAENIALVRTPVGDKYVLEEMLRCGAVIGGEQSGHLIFLDQATTGDGLLTALRVLEVMQASSRGLDELTSDLKAFPQTLVNVRVRERKPLWELGAVRAAIQAAEAALGVDGRVLVRFSGTEPLARVMVEGPTTEAVASHARSIAGAITAELGA